MSFEKFLSVVVSWPVLLVVLVVVTIVFGWRKYRLKGATREIIEIASTRTMVILSAIFAIIFSGRVVFEYYRELLSFFDQFLYGTGIGASWFVGIFGLMLGGAMMMVFFGISEGISMEKNDHLIARLERLQKWDKYDRKMAAVAAPDPFADCEFYRFSLDEEGDMVKTLVEKW